MNISPAAARGLIKLSIKDEMNPFTKMETLEFKDFQKIIRNALKTRLSELNVQNIQDIINSLDQILINNQSLFTITKI